MSVVGIDLGTTNTVVASVRAGKVHVLADERGERLLPSVVSFHPNGELLVGSAARARRIIDPKNTIYSHKRLIGRAWGSPELNEAKQRLSFELREGPGQAPVVFARTKTYTLPEISAFVLKRTRQIAETALGETVTHAVITVPAHFNELQRASTKAAGRISGVEVLRILNEPTAAALAYGLGRGGTERVAVYDFGGGTFDCTLLNLNGNVFEVLATAGDTFLGGDDIDAMIADRMAETLLRTHRVDLRTDASLFARLRSAGEEVKIALSTAETHTTLVSDIAHGMGGSAISFSFTMTRQELDALVKPLIDRTFKVTEDSLALARLTPTSFDKVLLVGGSTRIPSVRKRVEAFFGIKPLDRVNPDEVVAIGAAIQAAALSEGTKRRSIPAPPGILSAKARTFPGAPAPPSDNLPIAKPSTEAGRRALIADVARQPPSKSVTQPGLPASPGSSEANLGRTSIGVAPGSTPREPDLPTAARPKARSVTNEVPGGAFGVLTDLPLAAASEPSRDPAPTVPGEAHDDDDLPSVKASAPSKPGTRRIEPPSRASAKDASKSSNEDVTASFSLTSLQDDVQETTQESPTLANADLPMPKASSREMPSSRSAAGEPMRARAPSIPPPVPQARPLNATAPLRGIPKFEPTPLNATAPLRGIPKFEPPPAPPMTAPLPVAPNTAPLPTQPRPRSEPPMKLPSFGNFAAVTAPTAETAMMGGAPILVDVTPRALVVETAGGFTDTIVPRNSKIPCEQTHKFATGSHMQTSVRVRVAQGENATFAGNTYLGEVELSGLRAAPRGEVVIAVTFEVDSDGTVRVRARDVQTNVEARAALKLVGVANDAEVTAMMNRVLEQPVGPGPR